MNAVCYHIHTEDKKNLGAIVSGFFEGFTVFRGLGYWRETPEHAARIDIIGTVADRPKVLDAAERIRTVNKQEAVYVTAEMVQFDDVHRPATAAAPQPTTTHHLHGDLLDDLFAVEEALSDDDVARASKRLEEAIARLRRENDYKIGLTA